MPVEDFKNLLVASNGINPTWSGPIGVHDSDQALELLQQQMSSLSLPGTGQLQGASGAVPAASNIQRVGASGGFFGSRSLTPSQVMPNSALSALASQRSSSGASAFSSAFSTSANASSCSSIVTQSSLTNSSPPLVLGSQVNGFSAASAAKINSNSTNAIQSGASQPPFSNQLFHQRNGPSFGSGTLDPNDFPSLGQTTETTILKQAPIVNKSNPSNAGGLSASTMPPSSQSLFGALQLGPSASSSQLHSNSVPSSTGTSITSQHQAGSLSARGTYVGAVGSTGSALLSSSIGPTAGSSTAIVGAASKSNLSIGGAEKTGQQDFVMQQEDFPALPGSIPPTPVGQGTAPFSTADPSGLGGGVVGSLTNGPLSSQVTAGPNQRYDSYGHYAEQKNILSTTQANYASGAVGEGVYRQVAGTGAMITSAGTGASTPLANVARSTSTAVAGQLGGQLGGQPQPTAIGSAAMGPAAMGSATMGSGEQEGVIRTELQSDGTTIVERIPNSMIKDPYGMIGILSFIRSGSMLMQNQQQLQQESVSTNMHMMTPGIDLTALLDINSSGELWQSFRGPFHEGGPCRPQDIDYHVPAEYATIANIRHQLCGFKPDKYSDDLLFFLFYLCAGEAYQLLAAAELYRRDWRFHKPYRCWLTRVEAPRVKARNYEEGTYLVFDATKWKKERREMKLDYGDLEAAGPQAHHLSQYQLSQSQQMAGTQHAATAVAASGAAGTGMASNGQAFGAYSNSQLANIMR